jgi:hypothetical protein
MSIKSTGADNYIAAERILWEEHGRNDPVDYLEAIAHALLAVAGAPVGREPLLELQRKYQARETDTRYGGQRGDHAAGYALGMKHAADLLGRVIDGLDAR